MLTGLLGAAAVLLFQLAIVSTSYGGNWTALFYTGGARAIPPALAKEKTYIFPGSGYDGQFYHYMAHDPLLRRGLHEFIDAPRLRYRRILVPASAWILAAGQDHWIDFALIAETFIAFFLGTYWFARYAVFSVRSPFWGLTFLLIPAAVVSLDRLTMDLMLTALCCGLAVYQRESRNLQLWLVLAAACLTRETGFLLLAGFVIAAAIRREWRWLAALALSAMPALLWYAYVHAQTNAYRLDRPVWHWPTSYPFSPLVSRILTGLDAISYAGVPLAMGIAFFDLRRRAPGPFEAAGALFALLPIAAGSLVAWYEPFGYPRVLSPLFAILLLRAIDSRSLLHAAPLLLVLPRLIVQVLPKALGLRGAL